MPVQQSYGPVRLFIGVVAVITLFAYFSPSSSAFTSTLPKMTSSTSATAADPIPGLAVTLAQVPGASPPAFRATITNNNPHAVSVLDYDSPLDDMCVPLGLVELTPAGASKPIDIDVIMTRRLWPPKLRAVHEIAGGGGSISEDIPIKPVHVPYEKLGDQFQVQVKGKWRAVMAMPKSEITDEFLQHIPDRPNTFEGTYESDKIEMKVDSSSLELK